MQTSTIKFSQIEDRIDAEYYKPEYLILNSKLKNQKSKFLRDLLSKIDRDPNFYNVGYTKTGIPLIRGLEFQPPFLELSKVEHISVETHKQFEKTEIYPKDLVMTVRGTIGKVAIVPEELKIANISPNLIFLRPKNLFQSVFLAIVLNSKTGQDQIERIISGSVQRTITVPDIESIKIPLPPKSFQQKIEKMVKKAQEKQKLADEKYKEAEEILNKELGLEDLDLSTQKTFEAKFSEVGDRFDPEYYQPKYKRVKNLIMKSKFEKKPLIAFVQKYNCGFAFPTEIYLEKGIPLLRIKNLKKMEIDFEGIELLPDLKEYQEFIASPGDILISMSGTVGLASLVPENIPKAFVNQRITSISTEEIDKLYLCFYLNLPAINSLMVKETTGGVQKNITYGDIVSTPIPILPQSTQQKISSLIKKSFKLRKEAKELIDRAKREVEEIIERK